MGTPNKDEEAAQRSSELLSASLNLLPVGISVRSKDGTLVFVNETAAGQLPASQETPPGAFEKPMTTVDPVVGADGERTLLTFHKPVELRREPLLLSASFDVTEQKRIESELAQRAYFDELTGLANRCLIRQRVGSFLKREEPQGKFAPISTISSTSTITTAM